MSNTHMTTTIFDNTANRSLTGIFCLGLYIWLSIQVLRETLIVAELPKDSACLFAINSVRLVSLLIIALFEFTAINKTKVRSFAIVSILVIIAIISKLHTDETIFLEFIFIVFVSRNVKFEQIAKTSIYAISLLLIVVATLSAMRLIPDAEVTREVGASIVSKRSSMGFEWPSRLPNYFLCVCMIYVMMKGRRVSKQVLLMLGVIAMIIFIITGSRNPLLFTGILLVSVLMFSKTQIKSRHRKTVAYLSMFVILSFSLGILIITWLYDSSNPLHESINKLIVGRLNYGYSAMHYNGITPFGTSNRSLDREAQMIMGYADSSYVRLFAWYGVVPYVVFMLLILALAYRCAIDNNVPLLICVVLACMHGVLEGQLFMLPHSPIMYLFPMIFGFSSLPHSECYEDLGINKNYSLQLFSQ